MPLYREMLPLGAFYETLVHSGLHRHAGLALVDGLSRAERGAARSLAMQAVFEAAQAADADRIQLSVQNLAPASLGPNREEVPFWVSEHGFFLGVGVGPRGICPAPGLSTLAADQLVALDGADEAELFARLDDSCRRAVRKAQRSGVTTEWAAPESAAGIYCRLAARSAERTGETLAPPAYYEAVLGLPPVGEAARLLVARHEGAEVGALAAPCRKGRPPFPRGRFRPGRTLAATQRSPALDGDCVGPRARPASLPAGPDLSGTPAILAGRHGIALQGEVRRAQYSDPPGKLLPTSGKIRNTGTRPPRGAARSSTRACDRGLGSLPRGASPPDRGRA